MATVNIVQALNQALREEMQKDDRVVILGEDIGKAGGVFRVTDGLQKEFGVNRVIDTPLAESGIVGVAIGMALYGLKPVAEIQFADFIYPAFDQIMSELSKIRYRSAGQFAAPVVIRAPYGAGIRGGIYHSTSNEAYFVHTPGLKVVIPSTPTDAKGLLKTSIREKDPIIFLEPKKIYRAIKEEVPEEEFTIPLGKARIIREGTDVSVFCYGAMVPVCTEAAQLAEKKNIDTEVIDLRTLLPLDIESVLESVKKTGRVVVVHEAPRTAGFGAEISALIAEKALEYLEAPIARVTGFDTPVPYVYENIYLPDPLRVLDAIESTVNY